MRIQDTQETITADNADLSKSEFQNVRLAAASFKDCDLSEAVFDDINFSGSKIRNVNLAGVQISDCNLSGMTIDGVPVAAALEAYRKMHPSVDPAHGAAGGESLEMIRPFQESDRPEVVALWQAAFNYSAPHNHPNMTIEQKLKWDPDLFMVAVRNAKVVGTVIGGYDGHRGWIYSLAVDPGCRRQGIAAALVRQVEQALAARGCRKVNLQLLATNAETVSFYTKIGYTVEDRISMGKLL